MSTPPAKMRDGSTYAGQTKYLGNGVMRSCGKCGVHSAPGGFVKHRLFGMIGCVVRK